MDDEGSCDFSGAPDSEGSKCGGGSLPCYDFFYVVTRTCN